MKITAWSAFRKILWQLGEGLEGEGTGDQAENLFQHWRLFPGQCIQRNLQYVLQLEMLKGHFACETQDNRKKTWNEWTIVASNCLDSVYFNVKSAYVIWIFFENKRGHLILSYVDPERHREKCCLFKILLPIGLHWLDQEFWKKLWRGLEADRLPLVWRTAGTRVCIDPDLWKHTHTLTWTLILRP